MYWGDRSCLGLPSQGGVRLERRHARLQERLAQASGQASHRVLCALQEGSGDAMAISRHASKERQQGAGGRGDRPGAGLSGGGTEGSGQRGGEPPYEHLLASMSLDK